MTMHATQKTGHAVLATSTQRKTGSRAGAAIVLLIALQLMGQPVNASEARMSGTTSGPVQGRAWLQQQPMHHFTLQLLATRNPAGVARFARRQGLAGPLVHVVVEYNGKEMHLLTLGSYATRAAAQQAASSLPSGIQPWIRSLASIRQVMIRQANPVKKAAAAFEAPEGGIKDMPWLWSQDPQAYTIQLAGAESRRAVEAVLQQAALPGERMVVRTWAKNRPWYALIYGRFVDEAAARATIGRLPEPLQQAGPWPRRFAALHDEIRRTTPEK